MTRADIRVNSGGCGVTAAARREFGQEVLEVTSSALVILLGAFRKVPTSDEAEG